VVRGCAPSQEIYEFFISKWRDMVQSGCVVFEIHVSRGDCQRLAVFRSSAEGKKIKHLSKYWGSSTQDDPCRSNIGGRDPCGVDAYEAEAPGGRTGTRAWPSRPVRRRPATVC